jgi:hypothetical protein
LGPSPVRPCAKRQMRWTQGAFAGRALKWPAPGGPSSACVALRCLHQVATAHSHGIESVGGFVCKCASRSPAVPARQQQGGSGCVACGKGVGPGPGDRAKPPLALSRAHCIVCMSPKTKHARRGWQAAFRFVDGAPSIGVMRGAVNWRWWGRHGQGWQR